MPRGERTVLDRVVADLPGRCYKPLDLSKRDANARGAERARAAKTGPVPALDAPDARVTTHPAWPAFERWVLEQGDATHKVVRPDLLACRREAWEFVWEVFRAGWSAGKGSLGES